VADGQRKRTYMATSKDANTDSYLGWAEKQFRNPYFLEFQE
jgi:hypothetical protein